ncbi:hypothetical protein [Chryseobacterium lathyri]|jgi:hypothetical protein|uniref:Uncharacterized protein n=1 Tax=Chryseobacterium lathyri TaxID=395933 RepID=A0A511YAD9_9FLAO|nr:hypothetical protein [Chryseobacterium lathyri]GEN72163.1 hypothetical protein CLA01_22350 [Chryseobacterium lathyri]
MPTFEEAYYKIEKKNVEIKDYIDKIHYEKIYCPECLTAPLHIVRKQNVFPYYASNSKQAHLEDCQHYEDYITKKNLNKLIESKNNEDEKRLKFLINNNLQGAINLLIKNEIIENVTVENSIKKTSTNQLKISSNEYKYDRIPRVSINRLLGKKEEFIDNYLIIWGIANIESKDYERMNSTTGKKFKIKKLIFRVKENFKFSIQLSENQIKHYKELPQNSMNKGFAVFGLIKSNNGFLELKILTTEHLQYL